MPELAEPTASQPSTRPPSRRWIVALIVGVAAGSAVLALRFTPVLGGPGSVVLLIALWILAPWKGSYARRFVIGGLLTFGLLWLAYTAPDIYGSLGRGTVLLSVATAVVAVMLVLRRDRALPRRLTWVDVAPPVTAAIGILFYRMWFSVSSGYEAMTIFRRGWDFASHFDMAEMLRQHGQTINLLPASPSGGEWGFTTYPQGFHAMAAFFMELLGSAQSGTASNELATFAHAVGLLWVLVATIVVASLVDLTAARERPAIAAVVSMLAAGALLWGPGAALLYQGMANLAVGCGLVMAAMAVAIGTRHRLEPIAVIAVAATVMCALQVWIPLAAAAAAAAALILLPLRKSRFAGKTTTVVLIACALAIVATGVYSASILASGVLHEIIWVGPGGVALWSLGLLAVTGLGCLAGGLALGARVRAGLIPQPRHGEVIRSAASCIVPITTLIAAGLFAAIQFREINTVGYYALKMLFIVELCAILSICAILPALLPVSSHRQAADLAELRPGRRPGKWLSAGAAVVAVFAASQVYGAIVPAQDRLGLTGLPSATWQDPYDRALNGPAPDVFAALCQAIDAAAGKPGPAAFVTDDASGSVYPGNLAQWFSAALGDWNDRSSEVHHLYPVQTSVSLEEAADIVGQLAQLDPELTIYTNERVADLALQSNPTLANRISVY